jgi:ComF family protein
MRFVDYAQRWLGAGGRIIFAQHCRLCGTPEGGDLPLCAPCARDLPWLGAACPRCALPLPTATVCPACQRRPPPQQAAWAALRYVAPVDRLMGELKFARRYPHVRVLGALAAQAFERAHVPAPTALVPVPLHASRLRERGFDQALELARELGRRLHVPVWDGAVRTRATPAQSGLSAAARRRNLRGVFALRIPPPPGTLAVVDDVMTTGATVQALARTLLAGGAQRVVVLAVARTP